MKKTFLIIGLTAMMGIIAGCSSAPDSSTNVLNADNGASQQNTEPKENTPTQEKKPSMNMQPQTPPSLTEEQKKQLKAGEDAHKPTTLTFTVHGGNFYYTPNEIRVKKGDTVRFEFINDNGFHNLVLDEFKVTMDPYQAGAENKTVEFVADKTGTFEFYCSVGSHRPMGMKGTLIVE